MSTTQNVQRAGQRSPADCADGKDAPPTVDRLGRPLLPREEVLREIDRLNEWVAAMPPSRRSCSREEIDKAYAKWMHELDRIREANLEAQAARDNAWRR